MSKPNKGSVTQQFRKRADKVAHISDAAYYADMAGRYYAKDKITRVEAQMMIDAAVGSPWALFMAWCRHSWRTASGAKRRMEQQFRAEQNQQRAIADDVAEQLDPATNESAVEVEELADAVDAHLERTGLIIPHVNGVDGAVKETPGLRQAVEQLKADPAMHAKGVRGAETSRIIRATR